MKDTMPRNLSYFTKISILSAAVALCSPMHALQMTKPYNPMLRPEYRTYERGGISTMFEFGAGPAHGYNSCGERVNATRVWSSDQDALAMLKGFSPSLSLNVIDDGVRGHFLTCGDLRLKYGISISGEYNFARYLTAAFYMPFYSMALRNMQWQEQTKTDAGQDLLVREQLTNHFFDNVKLLGDGLWLGDWQRSGPGDLALMLSASNEFYQARRLLKKVYLNGRLGLTIPTGLTQDEDLIFALPFGYDGSMALFYGGGLTITADMLAQQIKAGFDVELTQIFGRSKMRRIKTDFEQTEPLLLKKVCAYKDWGMTQQFNLFLEWHHFYKGASFRLAYQFFKHGEDELSLNTNDFSNNIANSAVSLQEWTAHEFMPILSFDGEYDQVDDMMGTARSALSDGHIRPTVSLFAQLPFNGVRSIWFPAVGAIVVLRW